MPVAITGRRGALVAGGRGAVLRSVQKSSAHRAYSMLERGVRNVLAQTPSLGELVCLISLAICNVPPRPLLGFRQEERIE